MATSTEPRFDLSDATEGSYALAPDIRDLLKPLASLKITVVLFALSIFLVLAGTMAETKYDIWYVVHNYFRAPLAWIELQVFFPKSFFPNLGPIAGSFPFPGGWLIGGAMAVNLLAAHAVRFKIQAKGSNLLSGLALLGLGMIATALVILGGSSDGLQGVPVFEWSTLWMICKLALAGLCGAAVWGSAQIEPERRVERRVSFGLTGLLATIVVLLFVKGDTFSLGDSSMRILWQLIQGTLAGGVLLAGCWLLFNKRAGIVLLHGGVGLMMFSELLVGTTAIEGQMHIKEGDTVSFVQDIRSVELAVTDTSDEKEDRIAVIPQSLMSRIPQASAIEDSNLPFDVRVVQFLQNSNVRMLKAEDKNPATTGLGMEMFAEEAAGSTGTTNSGKVDESAIYVEFLKKGTKESLGTCLFSLLQSRLQDSRERSGLSASEVRAVTGPFLAKISEPTTVEVDGKPYHVALRFKRTYKPYAMKLVDVRTTYYPGTTTPKDYSSTVHITDATRDVDRDVRIWMNNPLRFAGETFYQSSVGPDPITGEETTGLQVVTNSGWMIPYVSCMIVGVGMLFQFTLVLTRFLKRRALAEAPVIPAQSGGVKSDRTGFASRDIEGRTQGLLGSLLAFGVVAFCAVWVGSHAREPRADSSEFDLYAAGRIPVLYTGRIKPLDTLARNALQVMSNKDALAGVMDAATLKRNWESIEAKIKKHWKQLADEKLSAYSSPEKLDALAVLIEKKTESDPAEVRDYLYKVTSERQPAIRWLFDLVSGRDAGKHDRVFRIENDEVLELLGLKRREGFLYSLREIIDKSEKFNVEVEKVRKKPADSLATFERKLLELDRRVRSFTAIDATFRQPDLPSEPGEEIRTLARERGSALKSQLAAAEERLVEQGHPPLIVPLQVKVEGETTFKWSPYVSAWTKDYFESRVLEERPADPAVAGWEAILTSYRKGEAGEFNRAVRKYQSLLEKESPPELDRAWANYEAFFNHFDPFYRAYFVYIFGFILSCLAWLGFSRPLNRAAFCLITFALLVHTFALVSRICISGRPPVTNLYSSAIFIGWGCVMLGLTLETVFRLGIGNVIASIAGFATLFISFKLAGDGDTFTVMQAVLDTQFWLATHVTCITLGYATTFLSGFLGLFYVLKGVATPSLTPEIGKNLSRMIYGTLCFAMFFSFVGTVLGGLWADDSWGRFWGWDPKENGALIIVLWNALVLHARWDGMVKDRGMAVLSIVGNVVTSWSWFGVNELGIGLHSYGFTEGVLFTLLLFAGSQLAIVGIGCLPKALWFSNLARREAGSAA